MNKYWPISSKRALKAQASSVQGLGAGSPFFVLDLNSLKSHSIGFQVIQTGYWPDFNLESVFTIKNTFVMKNLTTSVKR